MKKYLARSTVHVSHRFSVVAVRGLRGCLRETVTRKPVPRMRGCLRGAVSIERKF